MARKLFFFHFLVGNTPPVNDQSGSELQEVKRSSLSKFQARDPAITNVLRQNTFSGKVIQYFRGLLFNR